MSKAVFFAGGGTGGHIYPALAVAEYLRGMTDAEIRFLCSQRDVDAAILADEPYEYDSLAAKPFGANLAFAKGFVKSVIKTIKLLRQYDDSLIVGCGGFVSAPAVLAARLAGRKSAFINIDIIPGKANRFFIHLCKMVFVQFEQTKTCFTGKKVQCVVVGCPLRSEFEKTTNKLPGYIDNSKKLLLVTGASSGANNLNEAMCILAGELDEFADDWQVVILSGQGKDENLRKAFASSKIDAYILEYSSDMAAMLNYASLAIGRSGAMSVAEYFASATPVVCVPYPYHKDCHQKLNAMQIVEKGCALIAEDCKEDVAQTASNIRNTAIDLMKNPQKLADMQKACQDCRPQITAAKTIAQSLADIL